jgi:hypothetical protein
MYYTLVTGDLPADLNPEGLAAMLDKAAEQVRQLDTLHDPESMQFQSFGVRIDHALEADEDPTSPTYDSDRSARGNGEGR